MTDPSTLTELTPDRLAEADTTLHPGTAAALLALTAEVHMLRTQLYDLRAQVVANGGDAGPLAGWPEPDAAALVRLVMDRLVTEVPR